jgi:hypothetical protein
MSYVFPPQKRRSDYDKMVSTQNELLQLRISNDANIENARKMQMKGTPLQMDSKQDLSASELLLDEGQQESNSRTNLEKLFRPQEVSDIISSIRNDPSLDYSMLNVNFPAIEADIKRRFNVKLITSTFFIEYFKKYSDTLSAATGMKIFQADNGSKINGMINNVSEIRRLLPDPNAIVFLERAARNAGITNANILRSLNDLKLMLPTPFQLNNLSLLDPVTQQKLISDILIQTQNLPSQSDINDIVNRINSNTMPSGDLLNEIDNIVNGIPLVTTNLIIDYYTKASSVKQSGSPILAQATSLEFKGSKDPIKKGEVREYLRTTGDLTQVKIMTPEKNYGKNIDFENVVFFRNEVDNTKKYGNRIYFEDTNIRELINVPDTKIGLGLKKNVFCNEPNIKLKVGRGLSVKAEPTFIEYGKYVIHMPMLMHNDLLNLKYKSLGPIPRYKHHIAVSDIFKEFLLDVLASGKPNTRLFSQLEIDEKKLFEDMSIGAGVWDIFNLKKTTTDIDAEESKRFEILRGEVVAGNNNPKLIIELRKLVLKFMNTGKIRKNEGLNLLMQLN